ncbi:MAG: pyridoxal phosphate-dependent aminotransferase [Candidatus Omnitrophica bacterium]|nr:pyridoxal phosphate-dependent aminotransferase [Candidatus Omnitrophota bacterium]MCB9747676.1 pyridoxal phosphate-dependent aminotransferase [Candidatus Omnitrophota bacterium]
MALKINKRIESVEGSSTLAITAKAKELKSKGADVVNFAGGEPDFDTPQSIKDAAIAAINAGQTKYTPSTGTVELKKAIVEKFKRDNNLEYTANQIAVSCGAKHSIFNIIQVLADEGDEVLIPAPYWVSYPEMVKIAGAKSKIIPTSAKTNFKITADQLAQNISNKSNILFLNSPSNPTGMVYSKEELEAIAEVCVKNKIYVISDEIYEKLIYDSIEPVSIASFGKDIYDLTITVNGVSKAYSMTGWRIGYCAGNAEIIDYIKKFQDHSTSNPTSISQAAALQALNEPEELVIKMCKQFQERRDLITSLIDRIPQVSYIKPQGAFYVFCDFSKLGNSFDIAKRIIEEANVAIIPGEGFGAPGFMRLSFSTSNERIEEGVKRIADWIKKNYK